MTVHKEVRYTDDAMVREDIFTHIHNTFGIHVHRHSPNFLGLYNLKWSISTDRHELFVKCYHPKRYNLSDPLRRTRIGRSLFFQQVLHEEVKVCPNVWSNGGEFILQSESGHTYIMMDHFAGRPPAVGHLDIDTHYQLGKAVGRMHRVLSRFSVDGEQWIPSLTAMKEQWAVNLESALSQSSPNERAIQAIERQGQILSGLDLSMFERLGSGWAHWDLWADNILVGENGEVGFVDFDTVQFSYPEIDVARALLSCSLHEGELRKEAVRAFLAGYRTERAFPTGHFLLALKLLWCKEAHWWLKSEMDDFSGPPIRFAEELMWLTDHWNELDDRYGKW
ncbi:phosphotransferase enzyme family protein [Paenibacillus mendelii]|uniref:Phosphotransferase enzyme family protein n=1 Tax=Paenibacillus mendelii TaxID=206163 RepID=A0ABV6JFH1_9BACL|nr:phosphotransferase [Paenibacillus mendelii]MCQ6557331.1 phosphotransferase [Paenibacillus mendelii]